jgi:hypothetical protein
MRCLAKRDKSSVIKWRVRGKAETEDWISFKGLAILASGRAV